MFKRKLDVLPEIVFYTFAVAAGTFVIRRALRSDVAAQVSRIPVAGILVTGPAAVMDEAYGDS